MTAMTFNTLIRWENLDAQQQADALMRPAMAASGDISRGVSDIIRDVRENGDDALRALSARFDKTQVTELQISAAEIAAAADRLQDSLKSAMATAKANITRFHEAQIPDVIDVETQPGVSCQLVTRPVDSVGLYIPGGSAPLISTVLMLAVLAKSPVAAGSSSARRRRWPMKFYMLRNFAVWRPFIRWAVPRQLPRWHSAQKPFPPPTKFSGRATPM